MGNSQRADAHICPHCGIRNTATTGVYGARDPKPGDWSFCAYCLRPAVFVEVFGHLQVRPPTDAEMEEARAEPSVAPLLAAAERVRG